MTGPHPQPMTGAREAEVLRHIGTLGSVAEAHAFRDALKDGGEQMSASVYSALLARIALLQKREARR